MTETPYSRHYEPHIEEWSPIISADTDLSSDVAAIDVCRADLAEFVELEGAPKEELSRLWIHLTGKDIRKAFNETGTANGRFTLAESPAVQAGVNSLIGGVSEEDLAKKWFLFVDVKKCLHYPETTSYVREVFTHEIFHFIETVTSEKRKKKMQRAQAGIATILAGGLAAIITAGIQKNSGLLVGAAGAEVAAGAGIIYGSFKDSKLNRSDKNEEDRVKARTTQWANATPPNPQLMEIEVS